MYMLFQLSSRSLFLEDQHVMITERASMPLQEADSGEKLEAASHAGAAYDPEDDFFDALSSNLAGLNTQDKPSRVPFSEQRKVSTLKA